jgi:hypothetical protein
MKMTGVLPDEFASSIWPCSSVAMLDMVFPLCDVRRSVTRRNGAEWTAQQTIRDVSMAKV